MGLHTVIVFRPVCWLPIDESPRESFLFTMNTSNSEHNVVFRALDYILFRWFWIFVNANLVHKFSITDEEYNPVEESVLNVKQKVGTDSPQWAISRRLYAQYPRIGLVESMQLYILTIGEFFFKNRKEFDMCICIQIRVDPKNVENNQHQWYNHEHDDKDDF